MFHFLLRLLLFIFSNYGILSFPWMMGLFIHLCFLKEECYVRHIFCFVRFFYISNLFVFLLYKETTIINYLNICKISTAEEFIGAK